MRGVVLDFISPLVATWRAIPVYIATNLFAVLVLGRFPFLKAGVNTWTLWNNEITSLMIFINNRCKIFYFKLSGYKR